MPNADLWRGTPVLVTGHTGFKGSWLTCWLGALGARVHGYSLDPPTEPSLFALARAAEDLACDTRADLADISALTAALGRSQPRVVFHMAAQPLVRASYAQPVETFATNVMGTAHLLEAIRQVDSVQAVVVVTTDKVYENREWVYPYREADPLGGRDPYSASKAAAEIVTASYRASFFGGPGGHPARIATARAGNVIGGGDWATDRLVPDCIGAFIAGTPLSLRYPGAVRPWQHVLEPLSGYLSLAEALLDDISPVHTLSNGAWNFGPDARGDATVGQVANEVARLWGGGVRVNCAQAGHHPHEAGLLRLDVTQARAFLGWTPQWSLQQSLAETVAWYHAWQAGEDMRAVTLQQISAYNAASTQ